MLAVAMLALKLTVIDRKDTVFRRSGLERGHLVGVEVPLSVSFSDQVLLLGLSPGDGESLESRSGVIDLTTYWRVQQPVNQDYALVFTLIDGLGRPYAEASSGQQTSLWSPDQYARQQQSLLLWPGTPPGEYSLRVAVVDPSTGAVLDTTRPDGEPLGRSYELSLVTVSDSTPSLRPDGWEPARLLAADLGVGMALLGIDAPSGEVDAGGTLNLTLYWQAAGTMAEDWQVELRLLEADGTALAQEVFAPGQASYPTSAWRPGDVVRDARAFRVPARTPSGCYALCVATVGVSDAAGAACHPVLHVTVRAPCRDYRVPSMQHPLDRVIGNAVALLGYDIDSQPSAPGEPVELKLFWRAEAEMARSYTVFVHVVDANGRTVAQSDVVPGDGVRPTTGWLPGEIVPSIHLLEPPAGCTDGCYALRIGMYDRVTGERLPVSGHADLDSVLLSDALCCQ